MELVFLMEIVLLMEMEFPMEMAFQLELAPSVDDFGLYLLPRPCILAGMFY